MEIAGRFRGTIDVRHPEGGRRRQHRIYNCPLVIRAVCALAFRAPATHASSPLSAVPGRHLLAVARRPGWRSIAERPAAQ
jgi:hypothetical protein